MEFAQMTNRSALAAKAIDGVIGDFPVVLVLALMELQAKCLPETDKFQNKIDELALSTMSLCETVQQSNMLYDAA